MVRVLSQEQHLKAKEMKLLETQRQAQSWIGEANSDEPESLPRPAEEKSLNKTFRTTMRFHPDVADAIKRKAETDRKDFADVARDYIIRGLQADGEL